MQLSMARKMTCENIRWYAVRTQPRAEERAQANLQRQGFEIFTPRIARSVRHARRQEWRLSPLFPGYLFIRLDASCQRWRPVDSTFGVLNIVKVANVPESLPAGLVERMKALADETGDMGGLAETFAVGDRVRVMGGPFDAFIGDVLRLPSKDRIMLLISMATRDVHLNIAAKSAVLEERATGRPEAASKRAAKARP